MGLLNTKPNAHDFEELGIIYQHLDSTTTDVAASAPMEASASEVDVDGPRAVLLSYSRM